MRQHKKQMKLYLIFVLGFCWMPGIAAAFSRGSLRDILYQLLQKGFSVLPLTAAILTRHITKDKTKWHISIKVWKHPLLWAFCCFFPALLTVLGATLYFIRFPEQYGGVFAIGSLIGTGQAIPVTSPFRFSALCIFIAAFCIPIQLLELGEEIGWREYLLPKQIEAYGIRKGVLLNGFFWGMAHLPLIYLGFNYSQENAGAPWSNMAVMMLVCMSIGILCSYVYVRSDNAMYSAIIHGVVNVIGEIPVFVSISHKSGLLGPNPTGLIGLSGFLLCAAVLFAFADKWNNKQI